MSGYLYSPSDKATYRLLRAVLESMDANTEGRALRLKEEIVDDIIFDRGQWHSGYTWDRDAPGGPKFRVEFWRVQGLAK